MIQSEGDSHDKGAATVHRLFATAPQEAEYMSEVLMGVRLRCANCHNHPLDHWTQDDYHGLAAIFAGFERSQVVRFNDRGNVIHPRTGTNAVPRIPGERFIAEGSDTRREFSHWLTRDKNPYFAKAMVVREFYLRALCRPPTGRERTDWVNRINASEEQKHERCEDFLWALLNSHEFTNNH